MTILKPLIVVELLIVVLSLLLEIFTNQQNYMFIIILTIIVICVSFLQVLVYTPAAFKTIQKRELGEAFTIEQAIAFQKNNKWRFFKVTFLIGLYSAWYMLLSGFPAIAGIMLGIISSSGSTISVIFGLLIALAGVWLSIKLIYKLYPRIFFALNIYLEKDVIGQECIRESAALGNTYKKEIWGYVVALFVINFIGLLLVFIPLLPIIFPDILALIANPNIKPVQTLQESTIISLWQSIVTLFFVLPMTFMYMSKAYAKIRALNGPVVSNIPQASTHSEVVTPEIVQ